MGLDGLDADEVRDPVGDDARLARPGAGEDQQRAVGGRHGPRLLGVEPADDLLGSRRAAGLDRGRDRLRIEGGAGAREVRRLGHLAQPLGLFGDRRRSTAAGASTAGPAAGGGPRRDRATCPVRRARPCACGVAWRARWEGWDSPDHSRLGRSSRPVQARAASRREGGRRSAGRRRGRTHRPVGSSITRSSSHWLDVELRMDVDRAVLARRVDDEVRGPQGQGVGLQGDVASTGGRCSACSWGSIAP